MNCQVQSSGAETFLYPKVFEVNFQDGGGGVTDGLFPIFQFHWACFIIIYISIFQQTKSKPVKSGAHAGGLNYFLKFAGLSL
jgi:hypothetical protein